jgi:peptidylprolyl isomerase
MLTITRTALKKITIFASLFFVTACGAANTDETQWRALKLNNTVLLTLPHGKVVIELAPQFSPHHVEKFSELVKKEFYDGNKFYRVIDGFVAQAGPKDGSEQDKSIAKINIEEQWSTNADFTFAQVQNNDLFAPLTGFKDSFAIGHDPKEKTAWLTHCPGVVAMARGNEANSATSHFYVVIGQAPRYLDRIMTIFGRVVYGMEHIQAIKRTAVLEGEYAVDSRDYTPIVRMQLMSDVPKEQQILIEVEETNSASFNKRLTKRRERENDFFYNKPPPVLDVCQVPIRSRLVK